MSKTLVERLRRNPLTVMDGQNITGDAADRIEELEERIEKTLRRLPERPAMAMGFLEER